MPLPLSYPGLRCVLENLEAVKRAHIIVRAPGLQKIDKLIPLRLSDFRIVREQMTINNLIVRWNRLNGVEFGMNGKKFSPQISKSREDTMKKLMNFYICARSIIHVHRLCCHDSSLSNFLPVDLKFRVNSMEALSSRDFETAHPFIDPHSFPLKTMITRPETSHFDNQIVQLAETLILCRALDPIVTVEDLKKLNNKTVVIQSLWYTRIDIIPLIKCHIETKKDIRTTFVISTDDKNFLNEMLSEFEQAFGEYRSALIGVDKRCIPGSYKFSIPINNKSRIQLYAIEDPEEDCSYKNDSEECDQWKIVIKPVSKVSGL